MAGHTVKKKREKRNRHWKKNHCLLLSELAVGWLVAVVIAAVGVMAVAPVVAPVVAAVVAFLVVVVVVAAVVVVVSVAAAVIALASVLMQAVVVVLIVGFALDPAALFDFGFVLLAIAVVVKRSVSDIVLLSDWVCRESSDWRMQKAAADWLMKKA